MGNRIIKSGKLAFTLLTFLFLLAAPANASFSSIDSIDPSDESDPTIETPFLRTPTTVESCGALTWVDYDWSPQNPEVGQEITFEITALDPITATPPITLTWDFADTHIGSGGLVTHTYGTAGTYWVYVTATNPCSEVYMSHEVVVSSNPTLVPDILVEPTDGFGATIYEGDSITQTLYIRNQITATADLHWALTEEPAASWLDISKTSGSLAPGGTDSLILTLDTTGLSIGDFVSTTLKIISNDPDESPWTQTKVYMQVLAHDITSVTLTVTEPDPYFTYRPIPFLADLSPDSATKPYTFTIDSTMGVIVAPYQASNDPLDFSISTGITGTHTITFTAWNTDFASPVSDSVTITILDLEYDIFLPLIMSGSN